MDDLDEELPVLSFAGPGDDRLRVHARGRDTAIGLAPEEVTEGYLVRVWPAPATATAGHFTGGHRRPAAAVPPFVHGRLDTDLGIGD
ncbi:hypothetical protein SHJG_1366 [Streptomyces hygroscopicus subsp. jinggangensis 5008]|nr:hypothetical protein SHJG_1366 [Streptomyces hygroscopicus subsp. jinggangensis 5008]AGF60866.1 hypothetical protein SHJGH_1200 [Streptomyces hygroscopicus subsp. jinggangensis TL01]